jgi:hypothetical protein
MENEQMRQEFIDCIEKSYEDSKDFDWFSSTLFGLPNCYAKGYLVAKTDSLFREKSANKSVVKVSLLEWAKYDIWK